uniref:tyrosine-type recombinase/integrase n=1 Tax=Petrachloros mirabilis TaxID=2918835 RepID=UPI001EE92CC8|nr:site-specific integrase [Petrachloros mirabilis]
MLKYKPQILGKNATELLAPQLFERYTKAIAKEKGLAPGSLRRYESLGSWLEKHLNVPAHQVSDRKAGDFMAAMMEQLNSRTAKERLWMLQACWKWAQGRFHIADENPWNGLAAKIKVQPRQRVKPFTEGEIKAILAAFRHHAQYRHYSDFVAFLFGIGCRFGEAAGLRWEHISPGFETVWIGESISRGHRKSTKTGKARTVVLSPGVAAMLRSRHKGLNPKPTDLVFPSPKGQPINDHNFRRRAWKNILERCHIEYRKPYAARHSAISHALANGANPIAVAEASGHDKRVLLDTYSHVIENRSVFVEF